MEKILERAIKDYEDLQERCRTAMDSVAEVECIKELLKARMSLEAIQRNNSPIAQLSK